MRPQKRYISDHEVLVEINSNQRKANKLKLEAEADDKQADIYFKGGDGETGRIFRDNANKKRAKASRLESKNKSLGETMSAIKTKAFDFMGGDDVVLQKRA